MVRVHGHVLLVLVILVVLVGGGIVVVVGRARGQVAGGRAPELGLGSGLARALGGAALVAREGDDLLGRVVVVVAVLVVGVFFFFVVVLARVVIVLLLGVAGLCSVRSGTEKGEEGARTAHMFSTSPSALSGCRSRLKLLPPGHRQRGKRGMGCGAYRRAWAWRTCLRGLCRRRWACLRGAGKAGGLCDASGTAVSGEECAEEAARTDQEVV